MTREAVAVSKAVGVTTLDGLTDVTITSAATGDVLRYNGTAWVDAVLAIADTSGLQTALDAKIGGSLGSTDNRVLRADGTGGSTAQGSAVTIDDSGNVTGVNSLSVVANGGQATFTSLFAGYVSLHFLASATNPTSTNYAFLGDASTTAINGGTQLDIRTGNVNRASFTSSLATISTNTQVNGNLTASGTVTAGGSVIVGTQAGLSRVTNGTLELNWGVPVASGGSLADLRAGMGVFGGNLTWRNGYGGDATHFYAPIISLETSPTAYSQARTIAPDGTAISLRANSGIAVRNAANNADAPVTCSNLTASGTIQPGGVTGPVIGRGTWNNDCYIGGDFYIEFNTGVYQRANNFYGWSATSPGASATSVRTRLSEASAGVVQIGTTANNALGSLNLANLTASGLIGLGTYTVATLPSASANAGRIAQVTDSSVTANGSAVSGGGSNRVMVFSNGTTWDVVVA